MPFLMVVLDMVAVLLPAPSRAVIYQDKSERVAIRNYCALFDC